MIPTRVFPGEAIKASTINDIIDTLQKVADTVGVTNGAPNIYRLAVACVNDDAEVTISAGDPVYITDASTWMVNTPILSVIPYDGTHDDEYPVGVARFDMNTEERGVVILTGLAVVNVASITSGAYLEPDADNGGFLFTDTPTAFRFAGTVTKADDTSSATQVLALLTGGGGGIGSLGVITQRPSGGAGAAVWQTITLDANGNWTASGTDVPVIIPQF